MNYLSKENLEEVLNLSLLQQCLLAEAGPGSNAEKLISQVAIELQGEMDVDQFQLAWNQVAQSHPILRTVFRKATQRAQTVQVVLKVLPAHIEVHNLCQSSLAEQEQAIAQAAIMQREPFNLAEGPLMRLALFRVAEGKAILLWTYHKIILDDQSQQCVLADVLSLYSTLRRSAALPHIKRRPYRDYLAWLTKQDMLSARNFWQMQLSGFGAPTELPMSLESSKTHQPGQKLLRVVSLDEQLSQRLTTLAVECKVSSHTVLQAAWALILSIYNNEEDVVFGLLCSGRPFDLPQAEEMAGCFAQTLPARFFVDHHLSLPEYLRSIQKLAMRLEHFAYIPLPHIQSAHRDRDGQPLFKTTLAIRDQQASSALKDAVLQIKKQEADQAFTDHLFIDAQLKKRWHLHFSCTTDLLDASTFERIVLHFQTILEDMADKQEARVSELNILPDDERNVLFHCFNEANDGRIPLDISVQRIIENQVAQRPEAIAAVCGNERITYRDLNAQANQLAHWLRAQGVGRDDLVGLFGERGITMLVATLAIAKAGGAFVPIDPAHPDHRLHTILSASNVKVIFTQQQLAKRCHMLAQKQAAPPIVFCLDQEQENNDFPGMTILHEFSAENPFCINQPHDLANVFYTSGSTGMPKGVMIEHIGMLNHIWSKIQVLGLSEKSIVVQSASYCFDIYTWQCLAPLMVGGKVVIYDNRIAGDPLALFTSVQRDRATVLEVVPIMLKMLLQVADELSAEERLLPDLLHVVSSGEALPVSFCREWLLTYSHVALINAYGATECSDDTTYEIMTTPPPPEQTYMSVGRAIPNFRTYILDRWRRLAPLGCIGEICFTGIGVGRGYLNDPVRTDEVFLQNPFKDGMGGRLYCTRDLGNFLPDGSIVFRGRVDFQVKIRGNRVELGEIEAVLLRYPAVKQAVAIVRSDSQEQNHLVAFVVADENLETATLRDFARTLVPEFLIPEQIMQLDALPLDPNGKVDRKALPAIVQTTRAQKKLVAPCTPTEMALTEIWKNVLEVPEVSIDDTFFELGGHSLKIIQVRFRIRQHFALDIELRSLFEHQTIRVLAQYLDQLNVTTLQESLPPIVHHAPAQYYPMSHGQRRLWFLHNLSSQDSSYNMFCVYRLEGSLNVTALKQAFQTLADRHGSLRTIFTLADEKPMQHMLEEATLRLAIDDLSNQEQEQQAQNLAHIIEQTTKSPFSLENVPPVRIHLVQLSHEQHVLICAMHHIISDAWSWQVMEHEFTALYDAFCQQQPNPLAPLPIAYTDYAYWQQECLNSDQFQADERYWLEQLAGELPILNLPTDYPRPAVQPFPGSYQHLALEKNLVAQLTQYSQKNGATLFMVLLAATGAFLARISGQNDIIVGIPAAGRDQAEVRDLIGFFVNTLPIRLDLSGNPTFAELLEKVKKQALDVYTHQAYPFDRLVDKINPIRDINRSSIFPVFFQVNRTRPAVEMKGLTMQALPGEITHTKLDLSIHVAEGQDELNVTFEYRTDLFETATIQRMLGYWQTLLQRIVADPQARLGDLSLLTSAEREHLLLQRNATTMDYPRERCVHELIEEQACRTPHAPAVVFGTEQLTYQELNRKANQLAHYLQKLGVGPDVLVGLCMERSLEMVVALLGILKAGGAYVPLDPTYPQDRLTFMLHDTQVPVLVTQQHSLAQLPVSTAKVVCLETDAAVLSLQSETEPICEATSDHMAYVIYTSGSTGKPKGVQILHRAVVNFLLSMRQQPGLLAEDTLLAVTTLSFDIAALELFLPLIVGARVVIASRDLLVNGAALAEELVRSEVTVMQATPVTWRQLLATGWQGKPNLKCLCGGEMLPLELARQLLPRVASLWNMYGPTETTIWSAVCKVTPEDDVITIGRPIANTQMYLLDPQLQLVPIGIPGELYIGGDGLAREYLKRPELTAERFIAHPFSNSSGARLYKTGDLARYRPDGTIECLGRQDHQVKLHGFRIELGEIEAALGQHPAVHACAVAVRENQFGDKRLVAYLIAAQKPEPEVSTLRGFLMAQLPHYMIPSVFMFLEAFPLTLNGKLDLSALPLPGWQESEMPEMLTMPRTSIESQLAQIWSQALGVEKIGIYENFFELGGDSILSIQVTEKARQAGLQITFKQIHKYQTIADVAAVIGNVPEVPAEQPPMPALTPVTPGHASNGESYVPSDFQLAGLDEQTLRKLFTRLEKADEN